MAAFDRDNLQLIFSALVDWWLRKFSYSQNISKLAKGLVGAKHGVVCKGHVLSPN
jgi:dynein heavy chain